MEEYREDLNEEQRGRSLRSRGEKAFQRFHRALLSLAAPGDVKPPMMPGAKNRRVSSSAETCQDSLPDPQFSLLALNDRPREMISARFNVVTVQRFNRSRGESLRLSIG